LHQTDSVKIEGEIPDCTATPPASAQAHQGCDVGRLIGEARRRILTNELFAQGASASSAALVALILLLVVGSEVLSWPVVLFVPLAALAIGAYRVRRRLRKPYGVAQVVDRRLNLADTLATAVYFSEVAPDAPVDAGVKRAQFVHAESV